MGYLLISKKVECWFLCKKGFVYIVDLDSMQFCMDFFLERINLASFFGKSVNNERRLMFVFIIFCNHLVYANIFAAITNYNQLVCLSKILSDFLEQFPKELIISLRLYLLGNLRDIQMVKCHIQFWIFDHS